MVKKLPSKKNTFHFIFALMPEIFLIFPPVKSQKYNSFSLSLLNDEILPRSCPISWFEGDIGFEKSNAHMAPLT